MEQTLGKRIAENRKRMKLTQDQLAERLGLTAQAISKWENDLSCPDINILPRLAEIFGITVDQLLGCAPEAQVHEAEVVDEPDGSGIHVEMDSGKNNSNWEFHWDSGRHHAVIFAIWVLLTGAAYLLARLMNYDDCSLWDMLWPSFLVVYGFDGLIRKFSIFGLGASLFGGYSLIRNLHIWEIDGHQDLILPLVILLFGAGLLIDAMKKPRKPKFKITHNGGNSGKTRCDCHNDADSFNCSLSFGGNVHHVDLPCLKSGDASVSFGQLTVDLRGCESVSDGCVISANCSFGELELLVPRRFRVEPNSSTAFACVDISGHPDADAAGIITLEANASFGAINLQYV